MFSFYCTTDVHPEIKTSTLCANILSRSEGIQYKEKIKNNKRENIVANNLWCAFSLSSRLSFRFSPSECVLAHFVCLPLFFISLRRFGTIQQFYLLFHVYVRFLLALSIACCEQSFFPSLLLIRIWNFRNRKSAKENVFLEHNREAYETKN